MNPDAAYLITGGLGGIGALVARWLAEKGAQTLVLMGRTPLPPREDWDSIDPASSAGQKIALVLDLEAMGVNVCLAAVDVADENGLQAFVKSYRKEGWPAIRGIMHAAGVTRDRLLLQMDETAMADVLRPKVEGSRVLHETFSDLDFFVMFSSIGSIIGPPGQGNYAAANAYLDALAHYRRAQGLPALSVNWPIWNDLGLAATPGAQFLTQQLAETGIASLTPGRALRRWRHFSTRIPPRRLLSRRIGRFTRKSDLVALILCWQIWHLKRTLPPSRQKTYPKTKTGCAKTY